MQLIVTFNIYVLHLESKNVSHLFYNLHISYHTLLFLNSLLWCHVLILLYCPNYSFKPMNFLITITYNLILVVSSLNSIIKKKSTISVSKSKIQYHILGRYHLIHKLLCSYKQIKLLSTTCNNCQLQAM